MKSAVVQRTSRAVRCRCGCLDDWRCDASEAEPLYDHRFGPLPSEWTHHPHLVQEIGCSSFQPADLLFGDVLRLYAELARRNSHINGNLLKAMVEDAVQPGIPARPDLPSQIFRGCRVMGFGHFDVPVPTHLAIPFLEAGEPVRRQRQERRALRLFKDRIHLSLGRAVNSRVGEPLFGMLFIP